MMHRRQDCCQEPMHTDMNVSVFEFNRRSIRPHFELTQLFGRHVLQCTYPLSWNQEASIRFPTAPFAVGGALRKDRSPYRCLIDA
jgi:hypothetical protein